MLDMKKQTQTEKRGSQRQRVLHTGKLSLNNGASVLDCVVRDLSPYGARVRLTIPTLLPQTLEFLNLKTNIVRTAEVKWSRNSEVGLMFTGPERRHEP